MTAPFPRQMAEQNRAFRVQRREVEGSAAKRPTITRFRSPDFTYVPPRPELGYTYRNLAGTTDEPVQVPLMPVQSTIDRYGQLSPMFAADSYIYGQVIDADGKLVTEEDGTPVLVLVEIDRGNAFFGLYGPDPNDPGRCVSLTSFSRASASASAARRGLR